ncbi:MAG: hypothetical protein ACI837_001199 [Crocinitomicaceae bacterium]|jgi:hypothetical protein
MNYRVLFLFILMNFAAFGQHNGFFGKKSYIELNSVSYIPLLANIVDAVNGYISYQKKDGILIEKRDWFDTGIRLAAGRSISNTKGFGLELGLDFQDFTPFLAEHEMLAMRTVSILPKMEFTHRNGLLPMGLNHQIGLGYALSKLVKKSYIGESYTPDYDENYSGITLLYGLNMRTPLSKKIMLNYGFRYTLNWTFLSNGIEPDIRGKRLFNVISFNIGITLPL